MPQCIIFRDLFCYTKATRQLKCSLYYIHLEVFKEQVRVGSTIFIGHEVP
jgi:hypothetical protein